MLLKVRKKRGRPAHDVRVERVRELTDKDIATLDATRERGGRPADDELNRLLLEGVAEALLQGRTQRDFVRGWIKRSGGDPPPDEVRKIELRINRARRKNSFVC